MNQQKGEMTVREAGKKGGQKGGQTTKNRYGRGFYEEIGKQGGSRVRQLVQEGKEMEKRG